MGTSEHPPPLPECTSTVIVGVGVVAGVGGVGKKPVGVLVGRVGVCVYVGGGVGVGPVGVGVGVLVGVGVGPITIW